MTIETIESRWTLDPSSFQWPGAYSKPSNVYKLWYFHLRFSEYYHAAHKVKEEQPLSPREQIISRASSFTNVLTTYEKFGNVWGGLFQTWWEERGEALFGIPGIRPQADIIARLNPGLVDDPKATMATIDEFISTDRVLQNNPETLIISVPLTGNRLEILNRIKSILDDQNITPSESSRCLINSKSVRVEDLKQGLDIMWSFCRYPHLPYWEIGLDNEIGSISFDKENRSAPTMALRNRLATQTSDRIQSIRRIIEHAAHGFFPSPSRDLVIPHMQLGNGQTTEYRIDLNNRLSQAMRKEEEDQRTNAAQKGCGSSL